MRPRPLVVLLVTLLLVPVPAASTGEETEVPVTVVVEDAPTSLRLTEDTVNADGKVKSPGEEVITRLHLEDANGLDDVASLRFRYFRVHADGSLAPVSSEERTGLDGGDPNLTAAVVEARFSLAPLKEGNHRVNVTATSRAGATVSVERTFVLRDVAATLVAWGVPAVARPGVPLATTARIGDANLGTGNEGAAPVTAFGTVTLKAFRGSSAAPGWTLRLNGTSGGSGGVTLDLSAFPSTMATVENGLGTAAFPIEATPPADAAEGLYRLSLYHTPPGATALTLLGSRTLSLERETRLLTAALSEATVARGGSLSLAATFTPEPSTASVTAALVEGGNGAWTMLAGTEFNATHGSLPRSGTAAYFNRTWADAGAQAPGGTYAVRLRLEAANGSLLDERVLPWRLANTAPTLAVAACDAAEATLHAAAPLPLCLAAADPDGDALGEPVFAFLDWEGRPVASGFTATRNASNASRFLVEVAPEVEPGRYTLRVTLSDASGGNASAALPIDVGAWAGVELDGPGLSLRVAPGGRLTGNVTLRNRGHGEVRSLALSLPPGAGARALEGATLRLLTPEGQERAVGVLRGGVAELAPASGGALTARGRVTLEVALALPPGTDAGVHVAAFRVLARVGAGPQ